MVSGISNFHQCFSYIATVKLIKWGTRAENKRTDGQVSETFILRVDKVARTNEC